MEKDSFSIMEFCQKHGLSRSLFYKLLDSGEGPRVMRVGSRIMISKEAAADWRRARETASQSTIAVA
jgi:predicted DNA-binding transcriptional regulator AlpA